MAVQAGDVIYLDERGTLFGVPRRDALDDLPGFLVGTAVRDLEKGEVVQVSLGHSPRDINARGVYDIAARQP